MTPSLGKSKRTGYKCGKLNVMSTYVILDASLKNVEFKYQMGSIELEQAHQEKYLGVLIACELKNICNCYIGLF